MNKPTVLITGALSGIGLATANAFAHTGSNIVVSGRNEEQGELLVKELRGLKIEADYLFADVRFEEDVRNLVDWTNIRFGSLSVAVNIAGTEGKSGLIVDQSVENFSAVFDMNVLGTFLSMKHEMRVMLKKKAGVIINISSTFGQRGGIGGGISAAGTHAVEGLTKAAALEALNENVRVNAVAPGPIKTDMLAGFTGTSDNKSSQIEAVPLIRYGNPEEIADTVVFLASDKASLITGHIFGIDGGKFNF